MDIPTKTAPVLALLTVAAIAPAVWRGPPGAANTRVFQPRPALRLAPAPLHSAAQQSANPITLVCFVHDHVAGDPPEIVGGHQGVYKIRWEVSDGSLLELDLASGQGIPCPGSMILMVTGAATGADSFDNFTCNLTHQQGCTLNIPVSAGGSLSGIPSQPTLTVPAGHTAVLNISSTVVSVSLPF